jgi:NitT/TauT family transport system permease protein
MIALQRVYLRHERTILGFCAVTAALLLWEGFERGWWADLVRPLIGEAAEHWRIKPIFISSPSMIAEAAYRMFFVTGEIWPDIGQSAVEFAIGTLVAITMGIPLGLAAGWYPRLSCVVAPFLAALNATPQVAFLPLLVIWIGTGFATKVLIIALLAVLPIAINAQAAVRTTDARLIKVAASFGASEWLFFRSVVLPSSVPFLLTGLRLAVGRGMIGIVVGEVYGSSGGIGMMISQAGSRFETDRVFVGVLTIVAAGVILVELLRRVEQRVQVSRP